MLHRMLVFVAALALAVAVAPAAAAEPETEAANAAVDYIRTLQNPDGGFPAFGEESAPGATIDAVFALIATGQDATTVRTGGNSPFDYLAGQAEEYATDPGSAAKLALAAVAGLGDFPGDIPEFGGIALLDFYDAETGQYGVDMFDHAFWILGFALFLGGTEVPALPTSVAHLRSLQVEDGGWEFLPGDGSDSNTTAIALQAVIAAGAGAEDPAVAAGLEYLRTVQNPDGGFGFLPDADTDPNTTAFVVQALVAAGEDIDVGGPWAHGGSTPLEALVAFQNPDTGAFQFAGEDSPFATYQAVPALMLAPFPDLETRTVQGSTPVAPTVVEETPMPSPTAPSAVGALPSTGGGPSGDRAWWWVLASLLAGGAASVAVGGLRRRLR